MLLMADFPKFFTQASAIIATCALAGLALSSVYLAVHFGVLGFPLALGIWLGTIIAADHILRWAFR
jgi:hypothetical protein